VGKWILGWLGSDCVVKVKKVRATGKGGIRRCNNPFPVVEDELWLQQGGGEFWSGTQLRILRARIDIFCTSWRLHCGLSWCSAMKLHGAFDDVCN
jgi:hypothetical protein